MSPDDFDIFHDQPEDSPTKTSSEKSFDKKAPEALPQQASEKDEEESAHILIIDDDPTVLQMLEHTLKGKYHVMLCQNGDQGIAAVNADISAVLLDIKMKGKDGFETSLEIKKRFPHLPIIFHSSYQDLKDPYEIMNQYPPFGYIRKEGNTRELMDILTSAVNDYQQIRKNQLLVRKNQHAIRKNELLVEYYSRFVPQEFLRLLEKESVR